MRARDVHGPRRSRPGVSVPRIAVSKPDPAIVRRPSHWVRVTCPVCGVVRVRAERVVLRHCIDDQTWSYRARCSACDTTFVGSTPESLALAALIAGLKVETWTLPLPSPRGSASPLRELDALELHLALLEPDWFEHLARAEPGGDE
jgi:hypothetical protein